MSRLYTIRSLQTGETPQSGQYDTTTTNESRINTLIDSTSSLTPIQRIINPTRTFQREITRLERTSDEDETGETINETLTILKTIQLNEMNNTIRNLREEIDNFDSFEELGAYGRAYMNQRFEELETELSDVINERNILERSISTYLPSE